MFDDSLSKPTERDGNGRFRPGCRGGPGRPAGSADATLPTARRIRAELLATWDELGPDAVRRLASERPGEYVKLLVTVLSDVLPDDGDADPRGPIPLSADGLPMDRQSIMARLNAERYP
ncbi:MAG: hypothetical protein U1A27_01095 [Phycisphaerae bacterium]